MRARLLVAGPIAVLASLVLAAGASASGKAAVVTTTSDDTSLTPPNCSLRDAITAVTNDANFGGCVTTSPGGDDKITFAPALSGQTIVLSQGEIAISDADDLSITGPGMNLLTVSGNDLSQVFNNSMSSLSITGMSLVHGKAPVTGGVQAQGGAINSTASGPFSLVLTDVKVANSVATVTASSGNLFADGGAIHTANGRLILDQSVITQNTATATGTGTANAEARGGAIFSEGDIQVTDSTISGNQATASTVGDVTGAQATSGIRSDGEFALSGSTMSGNVANADAPGTGSSSAAHGALYLNSGPVGAIEQSTIAANKGDASGASPAETGGVDIGNDVAIRSSTIALNGPDTATGIDGANIRVSGGANEIENTIIAGPRGGGLNCDGGTIPSAGFNDDSSPGGGSCLGSPLSSDLTSNPLLAAGGLGNNGGLTQTIALQATSPVIDQGSNADLADPNQDQRGAAFLRPVDFSGLANADNGTDIGAFEVQQACAGFTQPTPSTACPTPPPPPPPAATTTTPAPTKKKCKKKKAKKGASVAKKKCKKKK